jgi:hypothetical protein
MIKSLYYGALAKMTGRNSLNTPKETIVSQLMEKRILPTGMTEFDQWADRLIAGAMMAADKDSQKFALANMVCALGPTESHKEDAYFIKALIKLAANQIADAKRDEIRSATKAKLAAKEKAANEVLGDNGVPKAAQTVV